MVYNVVDLEFNQAFEFETGRKTYLNPECRFEVIQIGIVRLDHKFQVLEQANILIKPQIYTRVHPYVSKMTSLTMDTLGKEKTFPEIFDQFVNFVNDDAQKNVFCFWGNTDIKTLYRNVDFYKLDHLKLTKNYIDVQKLANLYLKHEQGKCIGLKSAIEALGLETPYPFHNAFYDAHYTAQILKIVSSDRMPVVKFQKTPKLSNRKPKKRVDKA